MFGAVIFLFVTGACLASEPTCSCSPFDYEEKLLTKMIRQEIMFEKFKEDMLTLQNKVVDKLADIDNERDRHKSEMQNHEEEFQTLKEKLQNEVKEDRDASTEELETLKHEFTNIMNNNTKQMNDHAQEFQKWKDVLDADTVAFFSKEVSDISPSSGQIFIFTTPIINEGNVYDKVTGKFTAPVGGLYKFDLQLCLNGGSSIFIYVDIVADNNPVQSGFFCDYDTYKCYTANALVRLQTGGTVWVKCDTSRGTMRQSGDYLNTFSGFRIHA